MAVKAFHFDRGQLLFVVEMRNDCTICHSENKKQDPTKEEREVVISKSTSSIYYIRSRFSFIHTLTWETWPLAIHTSSVTRRLCPGTPRRGYVLSIRLIAGRGVDAQ